MSSTNRSYDRHKNDYYVTPIEKVSEFLKEFRKLEPEVFEGNKLFLDPSAGGDDTHPMSYPEALKLEGVDGEKIMTIDVREDSLAEVGGNYLEIELNKVPDVIITNPPFNVAREIIEKALEDAADGGFVIMLVRLNFFGSKKRRDMWETMLPKYTFVHSRRISFTEDGKTDSIEYQHLVWQKGYYPDYTQLRVVG